MDFNLPEGAANHPCAPFNQDDPREVWYEVSRPDGIFRMAHIGTHPTIERALLDAADYLSENPNHQCLVTKYEDYGDHVETECVRHLVWDEDTNSAQDA